MKILIYWCLLVFFACLLETSEGVGVQPKPPAPSTALDPNFGHTNAELWRPRGNRNKRYYYYRRRYYGGYSRRYYYYWYRNYYSNYYSNYYNNYYYSYYYGKKK